MTQQSEVPQRPWCPLLERPRTHARVGRPTAVLLLIAVLARPGIARVQSILPDLEDLPILTISSDDTWVEHSARLVFSKQPIDDIAGDGIVHIRGDDLTVVCTGTLRAPARPADQRGGTGITIEGRGIRVLGAKVRGFKLGLHARESDRLLVFDADLRDGYAMRLGSTALAEDPKDWLWPHDNRQGQWRERYGAGLLVEDSAEVLIANVVVRTGQNGILLERVRGGTVYGCDASLLSGWGLALWHSSGLEIQENRFDFCVRGYSHGVYNRGQDSAGILLFEQSSHNRFVHNSACHGGDGLFGFAGKQALEGPLGEGQAARRGCNANLFLENQFNHAVAHGLELTFSFDNEVRGNRFLDNGICGVWLGYGRSSWIADNLFVGNGDLGYGKERGGINAEHAEDLVVEGNRFENNRLAARFWNDEDPDLAKSPWVVANGPGARRIALLDNRFRGPKPWVELEAVEEFALDPDFDAEALSADDGSRQGLFSPKDGADPRVGWNLPAAQPAPPVPPAALLDPRLPRPPWPKGQPIELPPGAPSDRAAIVITPAGPYDWETLYLEPRPAPPGTRAVRLLGPGSSPTFRLEAAPELRLTPIESGGPGSLILGGALIESNQPGVWPFTITASSDGVVLSYADVLCRLDFEVRAFETPFDPRLDPEAFRRARDRAVVQTRQDLLLRFGSQGPGAVAGAPQAWAALPAEHFAITAVSRSLLPKGRYRLRTLSDDGLRLSIDGQLELDDWTWHGPREAWVEFEVDSPRVVEIEVEYFELDGWAVLEVELQPG